MLTELALPPGAAAEHVASAVLADLRSGKHRGVVVDLPPGAGKSTLVVRAAVGLVANGEPLIVIAQTSEQVDGRIDRLAQEASDLGISRISARDCRPLGRAKAQEAVRLGAHKLALRGRTGDG